ncbi:MAG: bifunctional tetrahydrofolate synthase/dihydrofolate synthase [Stenotrophobium sp.]
MLPDLIRPTANSNLADWLRWQEGAHPRAIELGLERVRAVAARLQLPDTRIKTLTVAGTNGKGSSATLAAEIYRAAGYRVGLYTSPHLYRYNERVAINGDSVNDADLCRAFATVEAARGEIGLTYFEYGTLAALWLFREAALDIQVLEVGLGGRLDAVNLVDADAALITNIGLDHTDWLGPDRESIGYEKAGVMRAGRPAICADPQPPASLLRHAGSLGLRMALIGRDYDYGVADRGWNWRSHAAQSKHLPMPGLSGRAQLRNAAGVLMAVQTLQQTLPVADAAIRTALPALRLPGRYQRIGDVILDVGHNAEAGAVLADNLRAESITGRILMVLGMLADKPAETYANSLADCVHVFYTAGLAGPRGQSGATLAARLHAAGLNGVACADVDAAYALARTDAHDGDVIVVAGSFLTVAAMAGKLDG